MPCLPGNRSTRHSGLLYKRFWATGPGPTALIPRAPQPIPGPVRVSGLGSCHVYKVSTCEVRGGSQCKGAHAFPGSPSVSPAATPTALPDQPGAPCRPHTHAHLPPFLISPNTLSPPTPQGEWLFFFFLICTTQTTAGHEKATGRTANLTAHRMSGNGPPGSRWLSLHASGRSEESRSAPFAPLAPRPQLAR